MRALLILPAALLIGCFPLISQPPPSYVAAPPPAPARTAPEFNRTAADLDSLVTQMKAKGFRPEGPLQHGQLEAFQGLQFVARRGRCYFVLLRLEEGASFSDHARHGVGFVFDVGGQRVNGGPGISGPGGVGSAGCPQHSSPARFDLQAIWNSAVDASRVHDLGTGPYTLQVYSKPITESQLAGLAADQQRQIEESRALRQRRAMEVCRRCVREREECRDGLRRPFGGSCLEGYDFCLRSSLVSHDDCPY